jgi:hypothetical protein
MVNSYNPIYHPNVVNHCPGCGRTHWYIGRITAECAFCTTAIPLKDGSVSSTLIRRG